MHLVRGMSTTSTKKRKSRKKSKSLLNAEAALAKYYSKLGVGKSTANAGLDIPDYQHTNTIPTAGGMIGNGSKKESNTYTGTEIAGIATMHKSNAVPVRKDSNDAIDIANMRR
jgi:hypothetical protein